MLVVLLLFLFIFQSTPSVGRATSAVDYVTRILDISIHALRGEGDNPARHA